LNTWQHKTEFPWQLSTIFLSDVLNNFIKKWLITTSREFSCNLFSRQASRPYKSYDLLWINCRV